MKLLMMAENLINLLMLNKIKITFLKLCKIKNLLAIEKLNLLLMIQIL